MVVVTIDHTTSDKNSLLFVVVFNARARHTPLKSTTHGDGFLFVDICLFVCLLVFEKNGKELYGEGP